MDLLIVPLLLGVGIWWLNRSEKETERDIANYRASKSDQQAYVNSMTDLLLKHHLRQAPEDNEVRSIARTLTLTVLPGLNGKQKAQVLLFLYESGLIERSAVVQLKEADLQKANLTRANLKNSNLRQTDLRQATLVRTNLFRAILQQSRMQKADLTGAILMEANLREANLRGATLREAVLRDTDLRWADLGQTDLSEANLQEADLRRADLRDANFADAVLIDTNLRDAQVTLTQLHAARLLQNITLPNGDRYTTPPAAAVQAVLGDATLTAPASTGNPSDETASDE